MARFRAEHLAELRRLHDQAAALLTYLGRVEASFAPSAEAMERVLEDAALAQDRRGMRLAARDIRDLLKALSPKDRAEALLEVRNITGHALEEELTKDAKVATATIARGTIRNETEYYALRSRLDHISDLKEHASEASSIAKLLDDYRA